MEPFDPRPLLRFYAVDTIEALVEAQAKHIERLQEKLNVGTLPFIPYRSPQVREG